MSLFTITPHTDSALCSSRPVLYSAMNCTAQPAESTFPKTRPIPYYAGHQTSSWTSGEYLQWPMDQSQDFTINPHRLATSCRHSVPGSVISILIDENEFMYVLPHNPTLLRPTRMDDNTIVHSFLFLCILICVCFTTASRSR